MTQSTLTDIMVALRSNPEHKDSGLTVVTMETAHIQNGWHRLLPAGFFNAVDGRPFDTPTRKWYLDGNIAQGLSAKVKAAQNELVIDYEHQTLLAEQNGQPAPAAGWFKDVEWREGSGLWIKARWTPRALEHLSNGEYRFLSAVFPYDKITGQPTSLHSAALVNRPGLDGVTAIGALSANLTRPEALMPTARHTFYKPSVAALSSQEVAACNALYIPAGSYLEKRERYCAERGTTWAQLSALTPEDHKVISLFGHDVDSFHQTKLQCLAEAVLLS